MVHRMRMAIDSHQGELVRREADALAAVRRAAHDDLCKSDPTQTFEDPQVIALLRHAQDIITTRQRATVDDVLTAAESLP